MTFGHKDVRDEVADRSLVVHQCQVQATRRLVGEELPNSCATEDTPGASRPTLPLGFVESTG